ncbi:hypothetical protein HKX69_22240 [Streptomyces argyrophyllae]|uniref:Uncharacterized protein n=1 Tax=Streptomyces argyrophylli TaxID=2726118 RepID=A0A6M4PMH5_9ACTN|nr:hypothetical protein HKX69_22240 [Streptomyces argyrophyllae]
MGDLQLGPAEPVTQLGHASDTAGTGVEERPEGRDGAAGAGRHGGPRRRGDRHRGRGRGKERGGGRRRRRSRRDGSGRDGGPRRSRAVHGEPWAGRQGGRREERRRDDGGRSPGPGPALLRSHARSFLHPPLDVAAARHPATGAQSYQYD